MSAAHRIGLALSGGGARGFAHIPVIEALDELGLKPSVIAGTSIGAIVGAGYAAGMNSAEMHAFVLAQFGNRAELLARLWKLRPRIREFFSEGGFVMAQLDIEKVLDIFMPDAVPRDFSGLDIPLKVVATDFYGWRETIFDKGPLFPALAASAAIPMLFRPVRLHDRVLVDGGTTNPLPFDCLTDDADIVIAVDVVGGPTDPGGRIPGSVEAIYGTTQLLMQSIMAEKMLRPRPPDILVRPRVEARVLDFLKVAEIMRIAAPVKDEVKRLVERAVSQAADR